MTVTEGHEAYGVCTNKWIKYCDNCKKNSCSPTIRGYITYLEKKVKKEEKK